MNRRLGRGGNGDVYRAEKDGVHGALKLLKPGSRGTRTDRFRDEIEALKKCSDIPGVIRVLDADAGDNPKQQPWLVMGLAIPITQQLGKSPSLHAVVQAMHDIAVVLEAMHSRGFSHRDIKPDNLFYFEQRWTVGDFGLVTFEGKTGQTKPNERIGPLFFMAPEMLNDADQADGKLADVFSIAKTLWVLATQQAFPLPGSYEMHHPAFRIGTYLPRAEKCAQLDKFVASATTFTPTQRPTMSQVCAELRAWLTPSEEPILAIKFDTSRYAAQIARDQEAMVAEAQTNALRKSQLVAAAERIRGTLAPFVSDVLEGLKAANIHLPTAVWNEQKHALIIRGDLPGVIPCSVILRMTIDSPSLHTLQVGGRVLLNWAKKPTTQLLVWNTQVQFLEGGSEEPRLLEQLKLDAAKALQSALDQAFTISAPESSSSPRARSYLFEVVDNNGQPLAGAEVCLININGKVFKARTDSHGRAHFKPHPLTAPIAYVAHPLHRGALICEPLEHNLVRMPESLNEGSFIATEPARHWGALHARLNLIHDKQNRMYMYASDCVIDNGLDQPTDIALGQITHIEDQSGNCITICPQAARGESFLVNASTLRVVTRQPDGD
jgi:serine/threonine protein kinase